MKSYPFLSSPWVDSESSIASSTSSSSDESCGHPSDLRYRNETKLKSHSLSPSAARPRRLSRTNSSTEPGTWNIYYAVARLIDHLRTLPAPLCSPKRTNLTTPPSIPSPAEAITAARNFPISSHAWRSFPSLIFASLSTSVFDGLLDEHVVKLAWTSLDRHISGRTRVIGGPEKWVGGSDGAVRDGAEGNVKAKVKIELNTVVLQSANRDEIVGTLLHHMIHAYLVVVCESVGTYSRYYGGDDEDGERGISDGEGQRHGSCDQDEDCLAHGNSFAAILWEIRAQAAKCEADRERPLPIGFGHRLPSAFPQRMGDSSPHKSVRSPRSVNHNTNKTNTKLAGTASSSSSPSSSSASPDHHPRNSTHCPASVPVIPLDSVSAWYAAECAPFLAAAPRCMRKNHLYACSFSTTKGGGGGHLHATSTTGRPAPSASVAFVYDGDKPIGVPRAAVERFRSLREDVFAEGRRRWVELPRHVGREEEVGALMEFLRGETYRPVAGWLRAGWAEAAGDQEDGACGGAGGEGRAPVISADVGTHRRRCRCRCRCRRRRKARGSRGDARDVGSESDEEEEGEEEEDDDVDVDVDNDGGHCCRRRHKHHRARAHHLLDIRVYRLASAIGFLELATYAIRRLYSRRTLMSGEDPIELLETIYFPNNDDGGKEEVQQQQPPPQPLRTWVRAFLSRREDGYGSGMVSNMTKLQTRSQWEKRWRALLARSGKQGGRPLLEDVRAAYYMQDGAAGRQQQRQPQGMQYVGYRRAWKPWYTEDPIAEGPDGSSAFTTDESSHGDDNPSADEETRRPPYDEFNSAAPRHKQRLSPQLSSVQHNGYIPPFPGWWGGHDYLYPYPYSYPFPLSPSPAPRFFQYYGAPQPYESPHQQVQPQSQSRRKNSAPQSYYAAADTATTMSSVPTDEETAKGCYAAAKGDEENGRQRNPTQRTSSDGSRRRQAQKRFNMEWRPGAFPERSW
ncbi:uncharacterized protein BKCO1_570003 [Diplodia corticola]|uniref:SprT-like domain-containing protein n=1 Tax=Diplodia corticola TaxID=236234 RepID=A0A1J9RS19_9PEZI|nr:uncharacterized protein BKCO1_570003 [Diplodia corticola]OJD30684.1 hypothetical protein BKCO1_570003 [Diplodia corticola]